MNEPQARLSRGIPDIGTKTTMANLAAAFVSLPFRRARAIDVRVSRHGHRALDQDLFRARSSGG